MIAFAKMSESSDTDSGRKGEAKVSGRSERPSMSAVEATSRSTCRENMDEK